MLPPPGTPFTFLNRYLCAMPMCVSSLSIDSPLSSPVVRPPVPHNPQPCHKYPIPLRPLPCSPDLLLIPLRQINLLCAENLVLGYIEPTLVFHTITLFQAT